MNGRTGKHVRGSSHIYFKVLSQHMPGGAEENQEKLQSGEPVDCADNIVT
jgi:hypothetical protein